MFPNQKAVLYVSILAVLLLTAGVVQGATPTVDVTADVTEGSTRLVLTHSSETVYAVQESGGKLRVVYSQPVTMTPNQMRFDNRIVDRYKMRDDRTMVLNLGSRYSRYETFELANPQRLVIDFKAEGTERRRRGRKASLRGRPAGTIIVIDPGHGGVEDGAIGPSGVKEKEITLDLARRLKYLLRSVDRSVNVVLTRDEDRLVGLDERAAIANHNKADLFLSIHLNASRGNRASGAETYYLSSAATDDEARILAALENQSADSTPRPMITAGAEHKTLDLVLWDLAQNKHQATSSALAESVQRHMNELTGTRNRGVRQAPFRVLMGATMPAILVEVGFISNAREEAKFKRSDYLDQVASALTNAVQEFLLNLKQGSRGER